MKLLYKAILASAVLTALLALSNPPVQAAESIPPTVPDGGCGCICPCLVDGTVGCSASDVAAFKPYFFGAPFAAIADFDCDGVIGLQDLNCLRLYLFTIPTPPPC